MYLTWAVIAAGFLAAWPIFGHAAEISQHSLDSAGVRRTYYLVVPDSLPAQTAAPILILLHGSGSNGHDMARAWIDLATKAGIIIVAPSSRDVLYWRLRDDGPSFIRDVVNDVGVQHPLDTRRIYLFGHSGGAVYALTLAMLESEYFAAVAIHAGAWRDPRDFSALQLARRKIPVAMFVGSRDEFFPVKAVRDTQNALREAGHPAEVTVIKRHTHDYGEVVTTVNAAAWQFLRGIALDQDARYRAYD
jgi:poly(3-hydroxybutyrate) depolymerase